MTRDETIKTLRQIKGFFHNKRVNEATDMAIDALLDHEYGTWVELPREEGEWFVFRCSQCDAEYVMISGTPKENGYNYCPSCGAEMETAKKEVIVSEGVLTSPSEIDEEDE